MCDQLLKLLQLIDNSKKNELYYIYIKMTTIQDSTFVFEYVVENLSITPYEKLLQRINENNVVDCEIKLTKYEINIKSDIKLTDYLCDAYNSEIDEMVNNIYDKYVKLYKKMLQYSPQKEKSRIIMKMIINLFTNDDCYIMNAFSSSNYDFDTFIVEKNVKFLVLHYKEMIIEIHKDVINRIKFGIQ